MKLLNNQELENRTKEVASLLSYYNAAEGKNHQDETNARDKTQLEYNLLIKEYKSRGLVFDDKGFLVNAY